MKNDLDSLLGNFKAYFGKTELEYVFTDETVFTRIQRPNVLKSVAYILVGAVAESAGLGKDDAIFLCFLLFVYLLAYTVRYNATINS